MPADYKYEFISLGRLKALEKGKEELWALYRQLAEAKVIDPEIIARLRLTSLLVNRAAGGPAAPEEYALLEKILGPDLGEEKQT